MRKYKFLTFSINDITDKLRGDLESDMDTKVNQYASQGYILGDFNYDNENIFIIMEQCLITKKTRKRRRYETPPTSND